MPEGQPLTRIPWKPITPLDPRDVPTNGGHAALDALRKEWERHLRDLSEEEKVRVRQRSLRRLAIETGILERLYEIDWGLTLTLVAEGFVREVVERAGGRVDDRTLATLQGQMKSLEMVLDFVSSERSLTAGFIKELHSAITRTQTTYVATDTLGRVFDKELPHGEWKKEPNHVLRQDGSLLEYAPPEHVASEVDSLVAYYERLAKADVHPMSQAAWLHHRFVQIHPFADGNGRVARALTLLVLEKHRYAPLVVDRYHREDYLKALDIANRGDLGALTKLFVKLESAALTSELEKPEDLPSRGVSTDVAHTLAAQLAAARSLQQSTIQKQLAIRAAVVAALMSRWVTEKAKELREIFRGKGLKDVAVLANTNMPPDSDKAQWFHRQVIESAHVAGHYADFKVYAGWCSVRVRLRSVELRFIASLHGAGRDVGVMAVTTFALLGPTERSSDEEGDQPAPEQVQTTKDAFTFVHTEKREDIQQRAASDLEELLDEGLAVALAKLMTFV